jgi:hypothetical protein
MKTKEEIEKIAENLYPISPNPNQMIEGFERVAYKKGYMQCQNDMLHDQTVTRFEVIDENGRAYTEHYCKVELSYQDDGRTLKVFIKRLDKQD